MAYLLLCNSPQVSSSGSVTCQAWQMVDYEQIALKSDLFDWETYLGFDLGIFGQVLVGLMLSFVTGHIAGLVVRIMSRT